MCGGARRWQEEYITLIDSCGWSREIERDSKQERVRERPGSLWKVSLLQVVAAIVFKNTIVLDGAETLYNWQHVLKVLRFRNKLYLTLFS